MIEAPATDPSLWNYNKWISYSFDETSADKTNPTIYWGSAVEIAEETNLPELGSWPPAAVDYPTVGLLTATMETMAVPEQETSTLVLEDEVLSKNDALYQQSQDFNGYSIEEDVPSTLVGQQ